MMIWALKSHYVLLFLQEKLLTAFFKGVPGVVLLVLFVEALVGLISAVGVGLTEAQAQMYSGPDVVITMAILLLRKNEAASI